MNKRIFALVMAVGVLLGTVASAEENKYNKMDIINTSGYNMADVCKLGKVEFEGLKKEYGLPEDMPETTNETVAFNMMTLENWAKFREIDLDGLISDFDKFLGIKVTKDMLYGDFEAQLPLVAYVEFFTGIPYNEFRLQYALNDDVDDNIPYGDLRNDVARIKLEQSNKLKYFTRYSMLIMVNGRYLDLNVEPKIINDRTMVPLRDIFETLGARVDWDGETKTIFATKDQTVVVMQVGQDAMFVNGEKVEIDSPSVIVEDRTLVPVRAVANAFGNSVFYNEKTKTVVID